MCKTEAKLFGRDGFDRDSDSTTFPSTSFEMRNEVLVLDCLSHTYEEDSETRTSVGIVLTSRQIFRNVMYAAEGQKSDGVLVAADGTYRPHFGNWTLPVVGTYRTRYRKRRHCSVCSLLMHFAVWPNVVVLLDCHAHVSRKCVQSNFKAVFTILAHQKENEYADWFEKIYLDDRWSRWYICSAIHALLPSQNALESHNGDIKTCEVTSKKANTGVVLNDSIPGVFAMVAQDTPSGPFGHTCQGPLPSKMVSTDMLHVMKGSFFNKPHTVKDPLYVNGWMVTQDLGIKIDEVKQPNQLLSGTIKVYCLGSIYKWRVDFEDHDIFFLECKDLVDLILETRKRGLDVTRSAAPRMCAEQQEPSDSEENEGIDDVDSNCSS
ncbi:hypothetical protein PC119_g2493 [Phytophthora cactorum]|nr:hypothetical protein PC119_g2493 [Phytophthora cactorum]